MSPKKDNSIPVDVVNIDSSDDEADGATVQKNISNSLPRKDTQTQIIVPKVEQFVGAATSDPSYRSLDSRSFWKAGAYEAGPTTKTIYVQGDLEHARVNPKFLHSNATSHKWAFGAIAELLDNAVDEISNGATYVKVDRIYNKRDNSPALLFQDDGGGMDPQGMRKCMSLGYSSKTSTKTIGQYGNGFKTSTMRLGADVIVFSRASRSSKATQSIGLLSYTFLQRTGQDDVIVPMIDFDISDHWAEPILYSSQKDWSSNLSTILEWSPFATIDDLLSQFEDIGSHGTKVIIYNLWLNDEGIYELNFDNDEEDITLRDESNRTGTKINKKVLELQSHISYHIRFSLRAYASILYLRRFNNFKIILRGKPVEQYNIVDDLRHTKLISYKPQLAGFSKEVNVVTRIGFIKEAPNLNVAGFNVYNKNRLIRSFWKVTADGSSRGNGVVGVLEANFIEPAHDKQDFERSTLFFKLEIKLKHMVHDYWKGHCHLVGFQPIYGSPLYVPKIAPKKLQIGAGGSKTQGVIDVDDANSGQALNGEEQGTGVNIPGDKSIDQICEENIQLFMKCEGYIEKEKQLKCTVEELEKELEDTKKKCAQISANLELQKKRKLSNDVLP